MFDNDGTPWCEKPMPVEMGFILQRLATIARKNPALRDEQPWKKPPTIYGVPPERVVGTPNALCRRPDDDRGTPAYPVKPDVFDDGPMKPVRI